MACLGRCARAPRRCASEGDGAWGWRRRLPAQGQRMEVSRLLKEAVRIRSMYGKWEWHFSKTPRLQDLDVLHIDAVLGGAIVCQQVDLSRCSRRTSSLLRVPHHLASKKIEPGGFKENGGRSNAKCLARMHDYVVETRPSVQLGVVPGHVKAPRRCGHFARRRPGQQHALSVLRFCVR